MASTAEDEWEYEYDETETEDFYMTLDLSNTPAAGSLNPRRGLRVGHPTRLQSRLRALNAGRREAEGVEESTAVPPISTVGEMQITGLHTPNPLVMYDGQLLSCKWASTIGTDLFFVEPSPENEVSTRPLRSLPAVDLLAISSAKLTANVGVLRPRDDLVVQPHDNEEPLAHPMDVDEDVQPVVGETSQAVSDAAQLRVGETTSAPTTFLAKLNEAKAKRGENSRLDVLKTSSGSHLVAKRVVQTPHSVKDATSGMEEETSYG